MVERSSHTFGRHQHHDHDEQAEPHPVVVAGNPQAIGEHGDERDPDERTDERAQSTNHCGEEEIERLPDVEAAGIDELDQPRVQSPPATPASPAPIEKASSV